MPLGFDVRVFVGEIAGLGDGLAEAIQDIAAESIDRSGRFIIALPGGSVASTFFPRLAAAPIDVTRTHFFWVDERAVPPHDSESNFGLARRLWLDAARVPWENIHRMRGEASDLKAEAAHQSNELRSIAGDPPRLDLVLLGAGADGHIASVFPGALVQQENDPVLVIENAPKLPNRRFTMTLGTITAARNVFLVALGQEKAEMIRTAIEDPASAFPAAVALRRGGRPSVFLDTEAASLLPQEMRPFWTRLG